jgi:hypothetical protein
MNSSLWNLAAALNNAAPFIADRVQQVTRGLITPRVYYATIVRTVQVMVHEYLQSVKDNVTEGHNGVEPLEFCTLVTDLRRGTF